MDDSSRHFEDRATDQFGPNSSFVEALFRGLVDARGMRPFPDLDASSAAVVAPWLDAIRADGARTGAPLGIARVRELGLLVEPETWSIVALCRLFRELGGVDLAAALGLIAHLALGRRLVAAFGSASSRTLLERAGRDAVLSFALTEASPGSDLAQIQTFAEPVPGGYVLRGTKHWVTSACVATHVIVFARLMAPRGGDKPRMTAFLLERADGLVTSPVQTSVLPGSEVGTVSLDGVRVGADRVLGEVGKGFRVVMQGLAEARMLVGAAVLGACVRSFDATLLRLNERRAFGRPVGNFPSVQDRVADMLADLLALESLLFAAAGRAESLGRLDPIESAVVRLAASRASLRVLDASRELFGAAAFVGESPLARRWADTRALTLLDGSDLALESFIALEGTRRLRRELRDAEAMPSAGSAIDQLKRRARSLAARGVLSTFTSAGARRGHDVQGVGHGELDELTGLLGEKVHEECVRHGSELVEKQHLQRRLATIVVDLASWQGLACRVEAEVDRRGSVGARRMSEAAALWVRAARARVRMQFGRMEENDDVERDRIATRAYTDGAYPFDLL